MVEKRERRSLSTGKMTQYVRDHTVIIEKLPSKLRRNLAVLARLDDCEESLGQAAELCAREALGNVQGIDLDGGESAAAEVVSTAALAGPSSRTREGKKRARERVGDLKELVEKVSAAKVKLAQQSYDIVDVHIRQLDEELKRVEGEMRRRDLLPPVESPRERDRRRRKRLQAEGEASGSMAVDPNEPVYCICGQVAFGDMVGCDNADCEEEWFHLACVNLSKLPTGTWMCPRCQKKSSKKR